MMPSCEFKAYVLIADIIIDDNHRPLEDLTGFLIRIQVHGGIITPIHITSDMRLVGGRHRIEAKKLGFTTIPALISDLLTRQEVDMAHYAST